MVCRARGRLVPLALPCLLLMCALSPTDCSQQRQKSCKVQVRRPRDLSLPCLLLMLLLLVLGVLVPVLVLRLLLLAQLWVWALWLLRGKGGPTRPPILHVMCWSRLLGLGWGRPGGWARGRAVELHGGLKRPSLLGCSSHPRLGGSGGLRQQPLAQTGVLLWQGMLQAQASRGVLLRRLLLLTLMQGRRAMLRLLVVPPEPAGRSRLRQAMHRLSRAMHGVWPSRGTSWGRWGRGRGWWDSS